MLQQLRSNGSWTDKKRALVARFLMGLSYKLRLIGMRKAETFLGFRLFYRAAVVASLLAIRAQAR